MNVLTIGDIHGRPDWKTIDFDQYDRVIFLGDYVDSHDLDDDIIFDNLVAIIEARLQHPNRITLLVGNHDVQYIHFPKFSCSGYRPQMRQTLTALFAEHRSLFAMAYQQGNYLFTHAGISNKWLKQFLARTGHTPAEMQGGFDLASLINRNYQQTDDLLNLLIAIGPDRGGSDPAGGPVWADRNETRRDYLAGFQQVVGHTPVPDFLTVGDAGGSITYTDVLGTKTAFYEINIPD